MGERESGRVGEWRVGEWESGRWESGRKYPSYPPHILFISSSYPLHIPFISSSYHPHIPLHIPFEILTVVSLVSFVG